MKFAIVGAGAMGSLFGGRLADSGVKTVLVDVNREHIDAIRSAGLMLDDGSGARRIPIEATSDPDSVGTVDIVIIFCKHLQTRDAIRAGLSMIGPETYVWTLQNGIGNAEIIGEFVPTARIAKGLTSVTAILTGPGCVTSNFRGESETFAWPVDGKDHPKLAAAMQVLTRAGLPAYLAADIDYRIWRKLVVNASLTVLSAAVNLGIGPVGESDVGQRLLRAIVGEVVAVAQAKGIALQLEDAIGYMEELRHKAFAHIGSTTVDLQLGRRTEIDALNGAVAREGRRLGVPTPVNEVLAEFVRLIEATRTHRLPQPI